MIIEPIDGGESAKRAIVPGIIAQHRGRAFHYYPELPLDATVAYHQEVALHQLRAEGVEAFSIRATSSANESEGFVILGPRDWESEALGIRAGFVGPLMVDESSPHADVFREALLARALDRLKARELTHITIRIDMEEIALLHLLERKGFVTLDAVQHWTLPLANHTNPTTDDRETAGATGVDYRPWQDTDIPALRDIAKTAYRTDRLHADPSIDASRADAAYAAWIENSCRGLDDAVFVASCGSDVMGFMTVRLNRGAERHFNRLVAKIWLVGVAEQARGQGIGRGLIRTTVDWCRSAGAAFVEVGTQLRNDAALRLYARCGFVPINSVLALRALLPTAEHHP